MSNYCYWKYFNRSALASFGFLLLVSCATSKYDATVDAKLTELQQEVDTQMVSMISASTQTNEKSVKQRAYNANIAFYDKVDVDLTSLELRMEGVSGSKDNTEEIFSNIRSTLTSIAQTHKKQGVASREYWAANRTILNVEFGTLIQRELVYKGLASSGEGNVSKAPAAAISKPIAAN